MNMLTQSRYFTRRELRLDQQGVYARRTRFGNTEETYIRFEDIVGEMVTHEKAYPYVLLIGLGLMVVGFLRTAMWILGEGDHFFWSLLMLVVGAILLWVYDETRVSFWIILCGNGGYIHVHKAIPTTHQVDRFLDELIEARNAYLLAQYGQVNKHLNYEGQFHNLRWLRNMRVLNEEAYEAKSAELDHLFHVKERPIGFLHQ